MVARRVHSGIAARALSNECRMSEYQYYEFLAVDRPLSEVEQKELRASPLGRASRRRASPTTMNGAT